MFEESQLLAHTGLPASPMMCLGEHKHGMPCSCETSAAEAAATHTDVAIALGYLCSLLKDHLFIIESILQRVLGTARHAISPYCSFLQPQRSTLNRNRLTIPPHSVPYCVFSEHKPLTAPPGLHRNRDSGLSQILLLSAKLPLFYAVALPTGWQVFLCISQSFFWHSHEQYRILSCRHLPQRISFLL